MIYLNILWLPYIQHISIQIKTENLCDFHLDMNIFSAIFYEIKTRL